MSRTRRQGTRSSTERPGMSRRVGYVSRTFRAMMTRKAPRARTVRAMNALASDPPVGGRAPGCVVAAALVGATAELVGVVGPVGAAVVAAVVATVVASVGGGACVMAKAAKASGTRVPPDGAPSACTVSTSGTALAATLMVTVRVCGPTWPVSQSQRTRVERFRNTQPVNSLVFCAQREGCIPARKDVDEVDGDLHRARRGGWLEHCSCLRGAARPGARRDDGHCGCQPGHWLCGSWCGDAGNRGDGEGDGEQRESTWHRVESTGLCVRQGTMLRPHQSPASRPSRTTRWPRRRTARPPRSGRQG